MMSLRHLNVRHDIVKSGETYKASLNIKFCYFQIRMLNNDDPQFHRLSNIYWNMDDVKHI
jgi:hypothetical protein